LNCRSILSFYFFLFFTLKVDVKQPGLFFAIPGIDRIAYCVDMRETAIVIPPQTTITKDNVSVRWW
jgi:regulator of protease activity HflC (stomatin/prohibitin superfamily)